MLHSAVVARQAEAIHGNGPFASEMIPQGVVVWTLQGPTYIDRAQRA